MLRPVSEILTEQIAAERRFSPRARQVLHADGRTSFQIFQGDIYYDNKLGVGDGVKGWRQINWTLAWDAGRRGWSFQQHSFHPFLPARASGAFEFRDVFEKKDQITTYEWIGALPVAGVLLESLPGVFEGNCVEYRNAYGLGKDLIVGFTRSRMKMVVRIREGFYTAASSESFAIKVTLPAGAEVWRTPDGREPRKGYQLEMSGSKSLDTSKQTLIGTEAGGFTRLIDFTAFDLHDHQTRPTIDFQALNSRTMVLTKTVGPEFFSIAQGDIFIDPTTTYYVDTSDSRIRSTGTVWSTVRGASSGTVGGMGTTWCGKSGADYYLDPCFMSTDLSALTGVTIDSAVFKLYMSDPHSMTGRSFAVVNATPATSASFIGDDFDQRGSTEHTDRVGYGAGGYRTFTANAAGLSAITAALGGWLNQALRMDLDLDNTAPTADTAISLGSAESANPEYWEITYTSAPTEVGITKSLKYAVTVEISAVTKSLKYAVLAPVAPTKSLKYAVVTTPAAPTKSLRYALAPEVVIEKGLTYAVVAPVPITKGLQYALTTEGAVTKGLTYDVTVTPAAATKGLHYSVTVEVPGIAKTLAYSVIAPVAPTKSLTYEILTAPAVTKPLAYHVTITAAAIERGLIYALTTIAAETRSLKYAVTTEITAVLKSLRYLVRAPAAAATKPAQYAVVTVPAAGTKSLRYSVTVEIAAIQKTARYAVTSPAAIEKTLRYEVTATAAALTKSLTYIVVARASVTKSLKYVMRIFPYPKKATPYSAKATPYSKKSTPYRKIVP